MPANCQNHSFKLHPKVAVFPYKKLHLHKQNGLFHHVEEMNYCCNLWGSLREKRITINRETRQLTGKHFHSFCDPDNALNTGLALYCSFVVSSVTTCQNTTKSFIIAILIDQSNLRRGSF